LGSDEAVYLRFGVIERHVSQEWAPAYNLWYFILSKFTTDNIQLYYLNQQVLLFLSAVFLFLFLYLSNRNMNFAFVCSSLFAILPWTIGVFPKISLFIFICLLAIACIVHFIKDILLKGAVIFAGMYFCIYIRSEFIIAFVLVGVWFFYHAILNIKERRIIVFKSVILLCVLIAVLTYLLGIISFKSMNGMDKMYIAFLQHWGIYYTMTHANEFKNTTLHELYNTTFLEMFGQERTFVGIIKHQPLIVLKHILVNLFFSTKMMLKYFVDYMFPPYYFSSLKHIRHLILFIIVAIYVHLFVFKKRVNIKSYIYSNLYFLLLMTVLLLCISVPNFIIGFQEHYYYLLFCWSIIMVLFYINKLHNPFYDAKKSSLLFGLILIIFIPKLTDMNFTHTNMKDAKQFPNKKIYSYLDKHTNKIDTAVMVAVEGGSEVYLNKINIKVLPVILLGFNDGKSIIESVENEKVDYILVDNTLKIIANSNLDKGMLQIINSPSKFGFSRKIIFKNLNNTYLLAR